MIYFPDTDNYSCFVVVDSATIRAYEITPVIDSTVNYRDYYINSHYLYNDGSEYITNVPSCLSSDTITNDFYYRNDFDSICIIFMTCFFFIFFIPFKLYQRIFRRGA